MTDPTTSFLKRLSAIALSRNERLAMRERLVAYADLHQAEASASSSPAYGGLFGFISSRSFSAYAGALMLFLVMGTGITFAAEGSAPGDSLYAIKINVNEPVMTVLAPTAKGQAKVAATLATRRVDEAVVLASRGTLTAERQTYLAKEFDVRIRIAAKKADDLASTGDAQGAEIVRADLAANLAGEAQALGAVTTSDTSGSGELLRVVVATSESISDVGGTAAIASAIALDTDATTTAEEESAPLVANQATGTPTLMAARSAKVASTTMPTRFSKHLRVASTTLRVRFASSTLQSSGLIAPKVDVAIPKVMLPGTLTGGAAASATLGN